MSANNPIANELIVFVTEEHIQRGMRGSYSSCPISLAVKDALNLCPIRVRSVKTHLSAIEIIYMENKTLKKIAITFRNPDNAKQFIKDFDKGNIVAPISFVAHKHKIL